MSVGANKVREVIAFRLFAEYRDDNNEGREDTNVVAWQRAPDEERAEFRAVAEGIMTEWPESSGLKVSVCNTKKVGTALEEIYMLPPQPAYKLPD